MKEKYYTPKIEEFHIGFKFEVFELPFKVGASYADGKWVVGSLDTPRHFQAVNWTFLEKEIKERGVIRVKYLDREDIESFGFRFRKPIIINEWDEEEKDKNCIGHLYEHKKLNILLAHYFISKRITIATEDPVKNEFYAVYNKDNFSIGSLEIKNKSELKFILDRLPKND